MAGVDSLLRMLLSNNGDELKVATDAVPKMSAHGAPLRLSMPPTDAATLQHLLEGVLDEPALAESGRLERIYAMGNESFAVSLVKRGAAIEALFRRGGARPSPRPPEPAAPPPSSPVPSVPPSENYGMNVHSGIVRQPDGGALRELLARAVASRASDLHLCEGEPPAVRIDGKLRPMRDGSGDLAELALAELAGGRAPEAVSSDHGLDVPGVGRVRVNLYRTLGRLAAAVRLLPPAAPSLVELDLPLALQELVDAPHGLILVCGPTGAGKSATLAALAQEALSRRGGLLITLEDPVEYAIAQPPSSLVRQRQIGSDACDFGSGLRDALREDPDVLLVGEMRDAESIALALTAAETGHLVLASLHSRSSASTVQRIVDAVPAERQQQIRGQLADALRAVVCQRLLPRVRGGRVAALEILRVTHAVASLIREGKTEQLASAIQSGRKDGMLPLERCLADQVRSGAIERKSALAAANDVASLLAYLQG